MEGQVRRQRIGLLRLFCVLALLPIAACVQSARAENIDLLMSDLFTGEGPTYIGATSISREDIPATANYERKYLIVDFRFGNQPPEPHLQKSIHTICMAMVHDRDLMRRLTQQGYDMVSVAFDRRSQYDCL
ncbi:hypothetical protein RE428_06470 [Marinobacter nanhaiticus D15-8W]|uniref:hypothetical protein n=1 Tax=Marinobacter nanhaiticus TaxID=1305740 RepID=UPI0002C9C30D|nr:hypothetical protein [Marinobacter nanhaiticus]BES69629.1 hypothetical protein RE428_06470 [Marinobacter nanhaiticus D15-8W]